MPLPAAAFSTVPADGAASAVTEPSATVTIPCPLLNALVVTSRPPKTPFSTTGPPSQAMTSALVMTPTPSITDRKPAMSRPSADAPMSTQEPGSPLMRLAARPATTTDAGDVSAAGASTATTRGTKAASSPATAAAEAGGATTMPVTSRPADAASPRASVATSAEIRARVPSGAVSAMTHSVPGIRWPSARPGSRRSGRRPRPPVHGSPGQSRGTRETGPSAQGWSRPRRRSPPRPGRGPRATRS